MSTANDYGGRDKMKQVFGDVKVRYLNRPGGGKVCAAFASSGERITEYDVCWVEQAKLTPWGESKMANQTIKGE